MNIILLATRRKERISPRAVGRPRQGHRSNSYVTSDRMQRMVEDLLVDLPDMAAPRSFPMTMRRSRRCPSSRDRLPRTAKP